MKYIQKISITIIATLIISVILSLFLIFLNIAENYFFSNPYIIILLPIIGIALLHIYTKFGKDIKKGNLLLLESYNTNKKIPFKMAIIAPIATILSHLFGASVGREGIGLQIGGSIFSSISHRFTISNEDKQDLLLSGVSAGFAIIFGTPISGIVFGFEFIGWKEARYTSLPYSIIASFLGILITKLFGVHHTVYPLFEVPPFSYQLLLTTLGVGILSGASAFMFVHGIRFVKILLAKYFKNAYFKVFFAGSFVVFMVWLFHSTRYDGLGVNLIDAAFQGKVFWYDAISKILLTIVSIGGGFYGGEVTPLFAIGSSLGAALSNVLLYTAIFGASLGFISMFSGAAHAPLTGVILGIELFGISGILFYLIVCLLAYLINHRKSIYMDLSV